MNRYMKYVIRGSLVKAAAFNFHQLINQKMTKISQTQTKGLSQNEVLNLRNSFGIGAMVTERPTVLVLFAR